MALSYGFFDAELTPSGQYDRVYAAEQFAEYFHLIVSNGVFPDPATQLQVVASDTPNMNVNVSDGYGWINGYYAKNSGPYPLAIQAASGTLNRIDAVVLRWVNASRSMELAVKTGIAASSPATPALQRDTDVYELMLATVTVAAGVTSITQSSITDKRSDTSVCGWVTGAVQNIDTTNLFAQYDTAFQEWFDNIKSQLSGDVAGNLQNQIDKNAEGIATINATTLKADTKTALGLPASAGPDDAFKVLVNVGNLHVWERKYLVAEAGYTLGDLETVNITHGAGSNYSSGNFSSWVYSDEISVNETGIVSLVNPTKTDDLYYNAYSSANVLAGKYAQVNPNISPTNSLAKLGSVYFFPAGNSASRNTNDGSYNITLPGKIVSGYPSVFAKDFLTSTDQNAYPEGTVDNTTITYLGRLGEKTQMAQVYYIGTGIATSESNPLSLTFPFPPKIVLYVGRYEAGETTNSSTNQYFFPTSNSYTRESCHILMDVLTSSYKDYLGFGHYSSSYPRAKKSNDGKTVYWYAISTNDNPGNDSGVRYDYIAIG